MGGNFFENAWQKILLISWLDGLALLLLVFFGILGFVRGGKWQILRFFGVLAALMTARFAAPFLTPLLVPWIAQENPQIGLGIAYLLVFIATIAILVVMKKILYPWFVDKPGQKLKQLAGVKDPKHRWMGLGFGFLTAVQIYGVIVVSLLLLTSAERMAKIREKSYAAFWACSFAEQTGLAFPLEFRQTAPPPSPR